MKLCRVMDTAVRARLHVVARDVAEDVCEEPGHRLLALSHEGGCDAVEHEVGNATRRTVMALSRRGLPGPRRLLLAADRGLSDAIGMRLPGAAATQAAKTRLVELVVCSEVV